MVQALGSSVPWLRGGWEEEEEEEAGALSKAPLPSLHSRPSDAWVAEARGVAPGR